MTAHVRRSTLVWAALVGLATVHGCAPATGQDPAAGRQPAELLILGGSVVTMDAARTVIDDGGIAIRDGRISARGTASEIRAAWRSDNVIEVGASDIVMPGLVNGHNHAAMTLMRGVADDLALMEWLQNYIFPAESAAVDAEFVRIGTRLAALEMIASGTTTFTDMYYFEDVVAEVVDEAGLRGVLGQTIIGFPAPGIPTPDEALAYTRTAIERWLPHPRITVTVAPHAPYTVDPGDLRRAAALAREFDVPILVHLAETADEVEQIRERYDRTPVEHLEAVGMLGPDVIAHHAVWLTDADIELLARSGTGVVHNPESNMKLASGAMRVSDLRAAGVPVALGTDGPASNNDLDLFAAMTLASLLQKHVQADPTALAAVDVVAMATIEGARALGMDDEIGSIELRKQADIIIVRGDVANMVPRYSPYSHLVYAARGHDVRTTIVAGEVLYDDDRFMTLDAAAIMAAARAQAERIRAVIGRP